MPMVVKTNLGELGIGLINGHHHDNYACCQLDIFIRKMARQRGHNKIVIFCNFHCDYAKIGGATQLFLLHVQL
jgi:hypothetical protein